MYRNPVVLYLPYYILVALGQTLNLKASSAVLLQIRTNLYFTYYSATSVMDPSDL